MIENLKKTASPSLSKLGTNDPKIRKWSYKIDAIMKTLNDLNQESRELVNLFLAPYPNSSNESTSNMFRSNEPHINVAIARMLIDKNVQLYKQVNKFRPRIYFQKPILQNIITDFDPYDLIFLKEPEYQKVIDSVVNAVHDKVGDDIFDFSIAQQFIKMRFNYFFDDKDDLNLMFSDDLKFTVKQLREMSDDECFSLKRGHCSADSEIAIAR
jgi:hypothetical protein